MKLVTVIPLQKGSSKGDLTYFTTKDVSNGSIVMIPLRSKKILGLVINVEDARSAKSDVKDMSFRLRKIEEVKEFSIFKNEYLETIFEISRYFATTKDNVITSLIPTIVREKYDIISTYIKSGASTENNNQRIKTEKLLFQASPDDRISYYKTLIRESFALKKSIYIVLPTERDIKRLNEVLSKGIEQFTFTIHSGISKKRTLDKIDKIINTEHGILILGTAPFLSLPRKDIGIIIVEHENSSGYKIITKPRIDLRLFVELYASKIGAKLIFGDTLLRFETIARKDIDGLTPLFPLSYRINFNGQIEISNPRKSDNDEMTDKTFKIFSEKSIQEILENTKKNKNTFIFSLRKGLATMTTCNDCGEMVSCDICSAPLVLYLSEKGKKRMFVCNRCQREIDGDVSCKNCGGWNLMPLGIGTDTVLEELKKYIPKNKLFKLDKEVAKNSKGAESIIKEFEECPGGILVGTEMALFYLNKEVQFSIIASFDSLWSIPNYKMSEKIIDLMLSILRNTTEKFVIQTKNENDSAVLGIKNGNLISFIREEIEDRRNLGYPPFKRFIKITSTGDKEETIKSRNTLKELFNSYNPEIFSGYVSKLKGKYVTNALIKVDPMKWSLPSISNNSNVDVVLFDKLISLPRSFDVYIDPEDLL